MKQKDIALIAVVAVVSLVIAIVASNFLFGGSHAHNLTAEKVTPISGTFNQLDSKYFNSNSVDPTETITIGNNANQTPFNESTQQ